MECAYCGSSLHGTHECPKLVETGIDPDEFIKSRVPTRTSGQNKGEEKQKKQRDPHFLRINWPET